MEDILASTNAFKLAILAALIDTDGVLEDATLNLYQADVSPTPTRPLAEYDLADYTGNGEETIAWGTPSLADDGEPELVGVVPEFRPTDVTVGNDIFGAVLQSVGNTLLAACRFVSAGDALPLQMRAVTDSIICVVRVRLDPLGGMVVTIS